jgi:hypothetical protein
MEAHCVLCKSERAHSRRMLEGRAWDRALKTAHRMAIKEAKRPMETRFSQIEVYTLMVKKIFDHEFKRNKYVERERYQYKLRTPGAPLCSYHGEFDDAFCKRIMKKVEREYSESKWPRRLPSVALSL